jgi:MerR family transcriptional regulator/heat shock protein HspR
MIDDYTPLISIGTASAILGVSVPTLRLYEREGLLIPYKKESNHRLYSQSDIERLKCIREAIGERKFSIQAIKLIYSLVPCWLVINCTAKDRENCDAFKNHGEPCWTHTHRSNLCSELECRECKVYRDYGNCEQISNLIKETATK